MSRPTAPTVAVAATLLVAAVSGGLVSANRVAGIGAVLGIALLGLVMAKSSARLLVTLIGALLVFQSPTSLGKIVYLAVATLCFALSSLRLMAQGENVRLIAFRPMAYAGWAAAAVITLSLPVALSEGAEAEAWLQDVLPYILLITLPVVGLDAAVDMPARAVSGLLGVMGVVAAVGFMVDWLDRRHVSTLGMGRLILATTTLAALGFCYAATRAALGPHRPRWSTAAVVIAASMLVTGTRTNLVLLVALIGIVGRKSLGFVSPLRAATTASVFIAATCGFIVVLAQNLISDPEFLQKRIRIALNFAGERQDQSYEMRRSAYSLAHERFIEHPWFGAGPGYKYPNGLMSLDTPWMTPAKFGVVGTLVILVFLVTVGWCVRRTTRLTSGKVPALYLAARAWALLLLTLTPFFPWVEDKGTALAVMVLVASAAMSRTGEVAVPQPMSRSGVTGSSRAAAPVRMDPPVMQALS